MLQKYGPNLKTVLEKMRHERFTIKTAVQIGLQTIDQLEKLHKCGFIHNDLKPENMLLMSRDSNSTKSSTIILIDFGFATEFENECC